MVRAPSPARAAFAKATASHGGACAPPDFNAQSYFGAEVASSFWKPATAGNLRVDLSGIIDA